MGVSSVKLLRSKCIRVQVVIAEGTHANVANTVSNSAKCPENSNLDLDMAIRHVNDCLITRLQSVATMAQAQQNQECTHYCGQYIFKNCENNKNMTLRLEM